jgi:hypothetical protein
MKKGPEKGPYIHFGSGGRIDSDLPWVDPHPFGAHFVRPKR